MCFGHVSAIYFEGFDDNNDDDIVDDFNIKTIANFIGRPLTDGRFQYRRGIQPSARATTAAEVNAKPFVCITGPDGSLIYPKEPGKHPRV